MDDLNKPIEYQITSDSAEAEAGLNKIVSILERLEKAVTGITSALSGVKPAAEGLNKAFDGVKRNNAKAFDTKQMLAYSRTILSMRRTAESLSKSTDPDRLTLGKTMADAAIEADRLKTSLAGMDSASPEFATTEAALKRQMKYLDDLQTKMYDLFAKQAVNASEPKGPVIDPNAANPVVRLHNAGGYDPSKIAEEILGNKKLEDFAEIKITTAEEWAEAEKEAKKLERTVVSATAAMKRFAAANDSVGFGKAEAKMKSAQAELDRYKAAMSSASGIKADMDNTASLEDAYKRIEKLQNQIDRKEFAGKKFGNSTAVRRLYIDLNNARKEAFRLEVALGQIGGFKAAAEGTKLTVKGLIQARLHTMLLNREAKKTHRSMLRIGRVLQLMAVRMGVRAIMKDMGEGLAALAKGYAPFNEAMSDMMDSATKVRNSLISTFDPLIRVAAPIVVNWLDKIALGFDRAAQAAAAMTGATTYQKLTSEAQDYAATVNDIKNSLAGFDKFNLLGDSAAGSASNIKTEVSTLPIEEQYLKWKTIGDGLKELFLGVEDVAEDVFENIATLLGKTADEDTLEFLGSKMRDLGKWLQENSDSFGDWVTGIIAVKIALGGLLSVGLKVANAYSKIKGFAGLFKGGSAVAGAAATASKASYVPGEPGAIHSALINAGAKIKTAGAGVASKLTGAGGKIATALSGGVGATVAGAAIGLTASLSALNNVVDDGKELFGDAASYGDLRTGKDVSGWESMKIWFKDLGAMISGREYQDYGGLDPEGVARAQNPEMYNASSFGERLAIAFKEELQDWNFLNLFKKKTETAVPAFASGGIIPNRGQLFVANERGPELIGSFGGNRTGVLNQSGIVSAVSAGVERAVTKAMRSGGSGSGVTVKLTGDAAKFFTYVVEQNNSQFNRTGRSPLKT